MLKVNNLAVHFPTRRGTVKAVNDVSFGLEEGEILGLVGESGCGKSMTLLALMGLVPYPGQTVAGQVCFQEQNLLKLDPKELRRIRGRRIAMIFQDPLTTLNPVFKVGEQIAEALRVHNMIEPGRKGLFSRSSSRPLREEVIKLMAAVGIPAPEQRLEEYPHQFSGGECQKNALGRAMMQEPAFVAMDEPTSVVDATKKASFFMSNLSSNSISFRLIFLIAPDPFVSCLHSKISHLCKQNHKIAKIATKYC